jgi:ketosteroid isomerase-like protein
MAGLAERFMDALRKTEDAHDPGPVAGLFADGAELANLAHDEPRREADGARQFWADYLKAFRRVRSEFGAVREADGFAVLEWTSEAELPAGKRVTYRGVSILEADGERVGRFRTYYDTAALVTPPVARGPAAEPSQAEGADVEPPAANGEV